MVRQGKVLPRSPILQSSTGRVQQSAERRAGSSDPSPAFLTQDPQNRDARLWGRRRPPSGGRQSNESQRLTWLFAEQQRLTKAVDRQARLLKVADAVNNSTEVELLRQVNQEILDVSVRGATAAVPSGNYNTTAFRRGVITEPQRISEELVLRQGSRFDLDSPISTGLSPEVRFRPRRKRGKASRPSGRVLPPEALFQLSGPLLKHYLRACDRGYLGGPVFWLRSRYARDAVRPLARKGITFPPRRGWSVFDTASPLHWKVSSKVSVDCEAHRGFRGELTRRNMNFMVLARQSREVGKLPRRSWPTDQRSGRPLWPSYPTISESWEAYWRNQDNPDSSLVVSYLSSPVQLKQVRDNPKLAEKVVRHNICGVRADVSVPGKYLHYFKYRWGFLILRPKTHLSIGVVRFLLSQWKRDRRELLQFKALPLRIFLRECVPSQFITECAHKDLSLRNFFAKDADPDRLAAGETGITRPTAPLRFVIENVAHQYS